MAIDKGMYGDRFQDESLPAEFNDEPYTDSRRHLISEGDWVKVITNNLKNNGINYGQVGLVIDRADGNIVVIFTVKFDDQWESFREWIKGEDLIVCDKPKERWA